MQTIKTTKNFRFKYWTSTGKKLSFTVSKTTKEEIISPVSVTDFEKNGTQDKATRMKVINLFEKNFLYPKIFSNVKNSPWINPHNIKFNVAPCHSAVKKNVIQRFI